jgi:glycosyltransferase involved in cell wall biosynthesis
VRVAVIAQQASAGGGTRFLRPLVRALADTYEDIHLTVFVNVEAASRFGAMAGFDHERITVQPIEPVPYLDPPPASMRDWLRLVCARLLGMDNASLVRAGIRRTQDGLRGYDVVYLAWPYFLEPFDTGAPTVGTFHDFNFKHDFGSISADQVVTLERQVKGWIRRCTVAVTSSRFIEDELCRYYGDVVRLHQTVRLTTFAATRPNEAAIAEATKRHGVPNDYVVCPSNTSPHKNLKTLLAAYARARLGGAPPLVLMGNGTDMLLRVGDRPATSFGVEWDRMLDEFSESGLRLGRDVFALGYVADPDADALIAGARLLVAPSLYEAGSGPAVDAWSLGTPVVFSGIAPFAEHLECLGVAAEMFDPDSPDDIGRVILRVLGEPSRMTEMAEQSMEAMSRYTWADVARGYRLVLEAAIAQGSANHGGER